MENIQKHVDIKLVSKERTILSSYKVITEHSLAIEMKKTHILINTPVYLALSILELRTFL